MENRNNAFRQAEETLRDATNNIKTHIQALSMHTPPKAQNNMGGMKDALRDQPVKKAG